MCFILAKIFVNFVSQKLFYINNEIVNSFGVQKYKMKKPIVAEFLHLSHFLSVDLVRGGGGVGVVATPSTLSLCILGPSR